MTDGETIGRKRFVVREPREVIGGTKHVKQGRQREGISGPDFDCPDPPEK